MRKILITGASRGLGSYLLSRFCNDGQKVYGTYNSTIPDSTLSNFFCKVDICNSHSVKNWIMQSVNANDEIVLINCAAINYNAIGSKADITQWQHVIDVNLIGCFRTIQACLPYMHEKRWGRIINFSSVVAQKGIYGTSAYAASKAALWGLSRSLAIENAKLNITINTLNLGYMEIGMTINDVPEPLRQDMLNQIPEHTFGAPENVYQAILFLINSPYTTGATININGGLY